MDGDVGSMSQPLVSVVVPTYGRPTYLRKAIQSVLDQTHDEVELIVVDDHSPRPVEPTLDGLSTDSLSQFACLRHEENRGANAARNTGIEHADGAFVAFLDDDDIWHPEKLEKQLAAFESAPDSVGVVYTGSRTIDGDGNCIRTSVPDDSEEKRITRELLLGKTVVGSFSKVLVRATAIDEVGLPDERFPSWQDREWYLRLSRAFRFKPVPEPLVDYRVASHGQISDDFEAKRDVTYPLFRKKHQSLAAEYGEDVEHRFVSTLSRGVAASALRNGYYLDSLNYLLVSLKHYPYAWRTYAYLLMAVGGPITYGSAKRLKREIGRLRKE